MAEDAAYANDGASPSAAAAAMAAAVAPRGPYRGKCLYKTGKCTNERALKTSGTAHNLCDEHRRRQNEHQRKLDTKNRYARKDKRSSGVGAGGSAQKASTNGAVAVATPSPSGKASVRYAPYEKSPTSNRSGGPHATSDVDSVLKASGGDPAVAPVAAPPQQPQQQPSPIHGLPVHAHTLNSLQHAQQQQSQVVDAAGKVFLPNGAQPPQMGYPYMVQDFDGIVVPLPSYLEGHERIEFRARIYQKVLDFISEECIRRFGGKTVADIQAGGAISSSPATVVSATVPVGGFYGAAAPVSHMTAVATGSGSSTSSVASTPEHAAKKRHGRAKEEEGESAPEEEPETAAAEPPQRPLKKVRDRGVVL
uniref:Uncharacterized protein n=1 Tax=Globisporangium ultimum (strain ATCC 200006 / CBS 805.95 / DAOM BR144) TaxID=431595 RepID=K3WMY6_GLOUD